jgi:hypothetical protein
VLGLTDQQGRHQEGDHHGHHPHHELDHDRTLSTPT